LIECAENVGVAVDLSHWLVLPIQLIEASKRYATENNENLFCFLFHLPEMPDPNPATLLPKSSSGATWFAASQRQKGTLEWKWEGTYI